MHCDNCGSEVDEKDVYCGNCGHRIERDVEVIDHTHDNDEFIDVTPERKDEDAFMSANSKVNGANDTNNNHNSDYGYNRTGYGTTPPPRYKAQLSNSSAIISLICGILSLLGFFTLITAIIGLNTAKKGLQLAATGEYDGESFAKAGKICSTIGLVLGILQLLTIVFYIAVGLTGIFAIN